MKLRMYAIVLGLLGGCVHGMDEQGEEERKGIQYAHQVLTTGFVGVDKVARPQLPKNLQAIVYEYANVYEAQHSIPLPEHYGLAVGNRGDEGTAFRFRITPNSGPSGWGKDEAYVWVDYASGKKLEQRPLSYSVKTDYSNGYYLNVDYSSPNLCGVRNNRIRVLNKNSPKELASTVLCGHFNNPISDHAIRDHHLAPLHSSDSVSQLHCTSDGSLVAGFIGYLHQPSRVSLAFVWHTATGSKHYYTTGETGHMAESSDLSPCGTRFALGFSRGVVRVLNIGARVHNKHSSLIDATPTTFKYRARGSSILVKFFADPNYLVVATEEALSLWQLPEHNSLDPDAPILQSKCEFGPLEYPRSVSSDGSKVITLTFNAGQSYVAGVYSIGAKQGVSLIGKYAMPPAAYCGSVVAVSSDARHIVLTEPVRRMTVLQSTCGYKKYLEQQQSRLSCTKLMHTAKQYALAYGVHAAVTASAVMAAWCKWG